MPSPLDQPEVDISPQNVDGSTRLGTENATLRKPLAIDYSNPTPASEVVQSLDLGEGNVVKLDKLGPLIINSDGTLSRITNWSELSHGEQERTVRLLVKKRNVVRLQKLGEQEAASGDPGGEQLSALKGDQNNA